MYVCACTRVCVHVCECACIYTHICTVHMRKKREYACTSLCQCVVSDMQVQDQDIKLKVEHHYKIHCQYTEWACTYRHSLKLNFRQFLLNNLCIFGRSVSIQKCEFFKL